jgi:hypothetical protein
MLEHGAVLLRLFSEDLTLSMPTPRVMARHGFIAFSHPVKKLTAGLRCFDIFYANLPYAATSRTPYTHRTRILCLYTRCRQPLEGAISAAASALRSHPMHLRSTAEQHTERIKSKGGQSYGLQVEWRLFALNGISRSMTSKFKKKYNRSLKQLYCD